jgi:hypothetical protein
MKLKVFGEMHPDVAKSYGNIGSAYNDLGKYAYSNNFVMHLLVKII